MQRGVYETAAPKGRPRRLHDPTIGFAFPGFEYAAANPAGMATFSDLFEDRLEEIHTALWNPQSSLTFRQQFFRTEAGNGYLGSEHQIDKRTGFATLPYDGTLMLLLYEAAEMLIDRISPLGRVKVDLAQSSRFRVALAYDSTATMFDGQALRESSCDVAKELDPRRINDLIDYAYTKHPFLSIITSKTLFMRDFSAETHDRCLLFAILGEALSLVSRGPHARLDFLRDSKLQVSSEAYINEAINLLRRRKRQLLDEEEQTSTLQAVVLLAWHKLYTGKIRRALALFSLATELIRPLVHGKEAEGHLSSRVNGIPMDAIQDEMVLSMHWIVQSVALWASLHLNTPIAGLLDHSFSPYFPSQDINESKVRKLDVISGHASALDKQVGTIPRLCVLAQCYGLTSFLYSIIAQDQQDDHAPRCFRSTGIVTQLQSSVQRIIAEGRDAVDAANQGRDGLVTISLFHELFAVRVMMEAPSTPDANEWTFSTLTREGVLGVLDVFCTLAERAEEMSQPRLDRAAMDEEEPLYTGRASQPLWCSRIMVLSIDTCIRAIEVLLVKAGMVSSTGAIPPEADHQHRAEPYVQGLIRDKASRMVWILSRYHISLEAGPFDKAIQRPVSRHCEALLRGLADRGIAESPPFLFDGGDRRRTHLADETAPPQPALPPPTNLYDYAAVLPGAAHRAGSAQPKAETDVDLRFFGSSLEGRDDLFWKSVAKSDEGLPLAMGEAPKRAAVPTANDAGAGDSSPSQRFHRVSIGRADWTATEGYGYAQAHATLDHGDGGNSQGTGGLLDVEVGGGDERSAAEPTTWCGWGRGAGHPPSVPNASASASCSFAGGHAAHTPGFSPQPSAATQTPTPHLSLHALHAVEPRLRGTTASQNANGSRSSNANTRTGSSSTASMTACNYNSTTTGMANNNNNNNDHANNDLHRNNNLAGESGELAVAVGKRRGSNSSGGDSSSSLSSTSSTVTLGSVAAEAPRGGFAEGDAPTNPSRSAPATLSSPITDAASRQASGGHGLHVHPSDPHASV
ncbi:hypothetical protein ACQY0O_003480 [Thecaphora frezii]